MGVSDEHSSIEGVLLEATQAVLRQKDAERLRELRLSALLTLQEQLMSHRRNGIREDILCRLAGKKADRILNIRTGFHSGGRAAILVRALQKSSGECVWCETVFGAVSGFVTG